MQSADLHLFHRVERRHTSMLIKCDILGSNRVAVDVVFPSDYEKYEAPTVDGLPVQVYMTLSVMEVDNINEESMDFNIQLYVNDIWKDPRLNLSIFKRESTVSFPHNLKELMWCPDLVFDNAKSGELFGLSVPNTGVRVLQGEYFYRSSRYNLKVACPMALHYYPMDTQYCFLKTSFFSNPNHIAELHWVDEEDSPYRERFPNSIKLTQPVEPLKYFLEHPRPYKETETWTSGNYTYLYANFTFTRRLSGNLVNMYIPSTLVVVLSWLSFWLDISAVPARITLGVTSLLTLSTQVVQARGLLPPVNYMTALDVWLFACILMVFSSIIEFAVAYQRNLKLKKEVKTTDIGSAPHQGTSSVLHTRCERTAEAKGRTKENGFMEERHQTLVAAEKYRMIHSVKSFLNSVRNCLPRMSSLDLICRTLFPSSFILFATIYWIYYLVLK